MMPTQSGLTEILPNFGNIGPTWALQPTPISGPKVALARLGVLGRHAVDDIDLHGARSASCRCASSGSRGNASGYGSTSRIDIGTPGRPTGSPISPAMNTYL